MAKLSNVFNIFHSLSFTLSLSHSLSFTPQECNIEQQLKKSMDIIIYNNHLLANNAWSLLESLFHVFNAMKENTIMLYKDQKYY